MKIRVGFQCTLYAIRHIVSVADIIQSHIPHIVYQKRSRDFECEDIPFCVHPNVGAEATVYLTYIIQFYYVLPEVTAFVHGHQSSWHESNIVRRINRLNLNNLKYYNFNQIARTFDTLNVTDTNHTQSATMREAWPEVFEQELGTMPSVIRVRCCAQFAVHRDRIRLRNREFYVKVLLWLNTTKMQTFWSSRVLEFVWHIMFGELAYMIDP